MRGYRVLTTAVAAVAAALLLAGGSALGYAPAAASTWVVSGGSAGGGVVNSIAVSGSTAYLGGNFSYIGPPTGSAAAFDTSSDSPSPSWPAITGSVYSVVSDGSTGWYVGGEFSSIGTDHYDNLVHIKGDGTIDTAWQATAERPGLLAAAERLDALRGRRLHPGQRPGAEPPRVVHRRHRRDRARVQPERHRARSCGRWRVFGSNLYFGGSFTTVAGQTRNNAAAVALSNGSIDNWNPNTERDRLRASRSAAARSTSAACSRSSAATSRSGLASVSTGGTLNGWNPSPNQASVFAIAVGSGAPAPDLRRRLLHGDRRPEPRRARLDRQLLRERDRLEPGTAGGRQLRLPPGRAAVTATSTRAASSSP